MDDPNALLTPGMIVTNPAKPDWGQGQVQSNIDGQVTVNFEHLGKVVIKSKEVPLNIVSIPH